MEKQLHEKLVKDTLEAINNRTAHEIGLSLFKNTYTKERMQQIMKRNEEKRNIALDSFASQGFLDVDVVQDHARGLVVAPKFYKP